MPYYVLKEHAELKEDPRIDQHGIRWRKSWKAPPPFQDATDKSATPLSQCVYETHFAFAVTGLSHDFWTAYAAVDTYFDDTESVDKYHEMRDLYGGTADPFTAGRLLTETPIWEPRWYFVKVVEIRMRLIAREENKIVQKYKKDIEKYVC